jgi:hypothetical protein
VDLAGKQQTEEAIEIRNGSTNELVNWVKSPNPGLFARRAME